MKPNANWYRWNIAATTIAIGVFWSWVGGYVERYDDTDNALYSHTFTLGAGGVSLRVYSGGFVIGAARPGVWGHVFFEDGSGGFNILGFIATYEWRWSHIDHPILTTSALFGLPWWIIVAVYFRRSLDRLAIRRAAAADARRLLKANADRFKRERSFQCDPRCEKCGYDMRATLERCPECGWIPDFHQPLKQCDGR